MKKTLTIFTFIITIMFTACSGKVVPYYSSPDDITIDKMNERMSIRTILENKGGVKATVTSKYSTDEEADVFTLIYSREKNTDQFSMSRVNPYNIDTYLSDNPDDLYYYIISEDYSGAETVTEEDVKEFFDSPIYSLMYDTTEDYLTFSTYAEDDYYCADIILEEESAKELYHFVIDPVSGFPVSVVLTVTYLGEEYYSSSYEFTYSKDIKANKLAKETIGTPDSSLHFSSQTIEGKNVDESIISGYKLVMLNFWEPWCGPCVNEMPDIQKLFEKYEKDGFLVIGVYSTESDAEKIAREKSISYPLVKYRYSLAQYMSDYVPTTVFFDGDGNKISEQYIGAKSYSEWEELILSYLK